MRQRFYVSGERNHLQSSAFQLLEVAALHAESTECATLLRDECCRRVELNNLACIEDYNAVVINDGVEPMRDGE